MLPKVAKQAESPPETRISCPAKHGPRFRQIFVDYFSYDIKHSWYKYCLKCQNTQRFQFNIWFSQALFTLPKTGIYIRSLESRGVSKYRMICLLQLIFPIFLVFIFKFFMFQCAHAKFLAFIISNIQYLLKIISWLIFQRPKVIFFWNNL